MDLNEFCFYSLQFLSPLKLKLSHFWPMSTPSKGFLTFLEMTRQSHGSLIIIWNSKTFQVHLINFLPDRNQNQHSSKILCFFQRKYFLKATIYILRMLITVQLAHYFCLFSGQSQKIIHEIILTHIQFKFSTITSSTT